MRRTRVTLVLGQDLERTISNVKRDEYRREIGEAHNLLALNSVEHEVSTDLQLTQDDRVQLLSELNILRHR